MFGVLTQLQRMRRARVGRAHARVGQADASLLTATHPTLVPSEAEWAAVREALSPAYSDYVANVSNPWMAMSLETATYLYCLCEATAAVSVLDFGSGFSSYVFRHYASHTRQPVAVTSVDDDPLWLERTADFLRQYGCNVDALVEWSEYRLLPTGPHSVVFHDLAMGELREEAMRLAATQVSPGGVIIFDDAQHTGHRERMYAEAARAGLQTYSLRQRTLDPIDRWAVLGVA